MPEYQQTQRSKKTNTIFQNQATPVVQTPASNPYSIIQRAKINPRSLTRADIMQLHRTIGNQAVGRLLSSIGSSSTTQQATVQRQEMPEEEKCPSCMQRQEIPEEEEPLQGKMTETLQRQEIPEEEEPLQGKLIEPIQRQEIPEEEEPLQCKFETVQRQEIPEEEEPLQGKLIEPIQRQEIPEEEEPLQGKMKTIQRQEIPEEEEPLQGMFENKPEIACPSCFASPIVQRQEIPEEEEPLQGKFETVQRQEIPEEEEPLQTKRENDTGMPDNLKAGVEINDNAGLEEEVDGMGRSAAQLKHAVKSSLATFSQLYDHAYAQGTGIHMVPGHKKHLPHKAWHLVKQKQGEVRPTMQMARDEKEDKNETLLLPRHIPVSEAIYLIDASHRGDMYHLRAALAIKNHPLIVYNFKGENDLTNYLSNASEVQIYKLAYNPAEPREEDGVRGRVYRSVKVLSESDATKIIAGAPDKLEKISESMTTVPKRYIAKIDEIVESIFKDISGNTALLMYRDSGQTSLVYPELDSGKALPQLGEMMRKTGFNPVFCGAPINRFKGFDNIGEYWKELDSIPKLAGRAGNINKFKRDIEAEFMRKAYAMQKFKIVVGFRSGALDLFTFLGIPTISISLKDLVGEDRHSKFVGDPRWQRTNIQYDTPRSEVTVKMPDRGGSKPYMSPFWKMRGESAKTEIARMEIPKKIKPPGTFHPDDIDTVSKGLDIGIAKIMGAMPPQGSIANRVITRANVDKILNEIRRVQEQRSKAAAEREKVPKAKPIPKVEELSLNAQKIFSVLEANKGRVELKDSRDEKEVGNLFDGMKPDDFFQAYRELSKRHIVKSDNDFLFITQDYLCHLKKLGEAPAATGTGSADA